jgi:hypothetical protein
LTSAYAYGATVTSNNAFYNNNGGPGDTESSDPCFDSSTYDFRLRTTANAADGGMSLASIFSSDIVGTPRISGYWSVGAYQAITGDISAPASPANFRIIQ